MERTLSTDERIKKAEEIYQRRRLQNYGTNQARVNVNDTRKDYKLFKKMFTQIAICSLIYILFYAVKNSNYIFSEEFLKHTKGILSYDINIEETYKNVSNWFANLEKKNNETILNIKDNSEKSDDYEENKQNENEKQSNEINMLEKEQPQNNENIPDEKLQEEQTLSVAEDSSSIS